MVIIASMDIKEKNSTSSYIEKSNTDIFEGMLLHFLGSSVKYCILILRARAARSSKTLASISHNPKDYKLNSDHYENLTFLMKFEEAGLKF
jgi:hypothetical protein